VKFVVVFFAFNRPDLLRLSVESFNKAEQSSQWQRILVWQRGSAQMRSEVEMLEKFFDIIVETRGNKLTVLSNINFNRILGMRVAYEDLEADFVLGIEEDSMISNDSLVFIQHVYQKYKKYNKFMGVNLGSLESRASNNINGYTRLRYGLQGQAGGVTKNAWKTCEKLLSSFDKDKVGWDSRIEYYLKTGFMVTPNVSRMNDLGWNGGTHAPSDPNHNHYRLLRENWLGDLTVENKSYLEIPIVHSWRSDITQFKLSTSIAPFFRRYSLIRRMVLTLKNLIRKSFPNFHSN
jgi:hypothetical protein